MHRQIDQAHTGEQACGDSTARTPLLEPARSSHCCQQACGVTTYSATLSGVVALRLICVAAEAPGVAESPGRSHRKGVPTPHRDPPAGSVAPPATDSTDATPRAATPWTRERDAGHGGREVRRASRSATRTSRVPIHPRDHPSPRARLEVFVICVSGILAIVMVTRRAIRMSRSAAKRWQSNRRASNLPCWQQLCRTGDSLSFSLRGMTRGSARTPRRRWVDSRLVRLERSFFQG